MKVQEKVLSFTWYDIRLQRCEQISVQLTTDFYSIANITADQELEEHATWLAILRVHVLPVLCWEKKHFGCTENL